MPVRRASVVAVLVGALLLSIGTLLLAVRLTSGGDGEAGTTAPAAVTDGYAFWDVRADGSPVRWDPCSAIPWVLQVRGAPEGARAMLETAAERITQAGGPRFVYVGPSDEVPSLTRAAYQPDRYGDVWAPVLVAWAPPGSEGLPLRDSDRGISLPIAVDDVFVSGQVVFNDRRTLEVDFTDRATSWGATAIHEFAHVAGLDHVVDPTQLMHRFAGSGPVEFGEGDLAGLEALNVAGCLDSGRPRLVTVDLKPRR